MTDDLNAAVEILRQGGVLVYPTDTIWGIGCDATNEKAVRKIYEIKKREDAKTMLVLLDDADKLDEYVSEVPEIAWDLIDVSDTPLTIIYPGAQNVAKGLIADDGSLAIRIVKDEFCSRLIKKFGKPVVSTSANFSGKPWPINFSRIDKKLLDKADYVVKWRQNEAKRTNPSGIIKLRQGCEVQIISK